MAGLRLRFNQFELDEELFELRQNREVIPTQPKALHLLLYLARHRSRVVTKAELLQNVWPNAVVTDGSLNQAMSLVRRYLADDDQRYVRTVRGRGLQFVASAEPIATDTGPSEADAGPDTQTSEGGETCRSARQALLYLVAEAEQLHAAPTRYDLSEVDEVHVGRGAARATARTEGGVVRRLSLAFTGVLLSRQHFSLTRTRQGWCLVDRRSKNGTLVNGMRHDRALLRDGDVISGGGIHLIFGAGTGSSAVVEDAKLGERPSVLDSVVPALESLKRQLESLSQSARPVRIQGEKGSGKSATARLLHELSGRARLLEVHCAALDRDTLSAQLVKPSMSNTSLTLILDELDALALGDQAFLLSALSAAGFLRAGSRLVATATHHRAPLAREQMEAWLPLPDADDFAMSPLRSRKPDLGLLIGLLRPETTAPRFSDRALLALFTHDWPGNLTELARRLRTACALPRAVLAPEDLGFDPLTQT